MTFHFQTVFAVFCGFVLIGNQAAFAKESKDKNVTESQLQAEVMARQDGDAGLQQQIDGISPDLCALYEHLSNKGMLTPLTIPDYCPQDFTFCGGIVGTACPGGFSCDDDPRDNCDPDAGGADCAGICTDDTKDSFCVAGDGTFFYEGEDYFDGCNTCICGTGGNLICTEKVCPPVDNACSLPIDVGPCDAVFPRWGFDADQGTCVMFNYGGCSGNENNFLTEAECRAACPDL
jgi:hypothetical protein